MRVFVTGASGWIGSAVVPELLGAGHQVVGLARSDDSAKGLDAAGAEVHHGSLDDLDGLREAAAASDGVIHLAFKHDQAFTGNFEGAATADRAAIETFGDALAGSDRPFLIASGTLGLTSGKDRHRIGRAGRRSRHAGAARRPHMRRSNAHLTLSFADRGVRVSVVRLPPTVHGDGDNGFIATLIGSPAIRASRATSATDRTGGRPCTASTRRCSSGWRSSRRRRVRCCTRSPTRVSRCARSPRSSGGTLVSRPSRSLPMLRRHFAWLAGFLGVDSPASSELTRALLGW